MNDKVSIIIPAYNVEKYIQKCIQSCCEQTYSNIEIVVVDDGSIDNTWDIILKCASQEGRIISIKQENKGVSAARNTALDVTTGKWLLFLDADDWLQNDAVEKLIAHIENEDALICCDCNFVYDNQSDQIKISQNTDYSDEIISRDDLVKYIGRKSKFRLGSSCYKLFSKKLIDTHKIRFIPGIHQGEDGLFTFMYICHITKAIYFRDTLWNIYERPGSACNSPYNKKWITALDAASAMLDYGKELSNDEKVLIKAYKAERAMWLVTSCVGTSSYSENDFLRFRMILKKNGRYLIQRERKLKTMLLVMLYSIIPVPLSKKVINITQQRRKRLMR